MAAIRLWHHYYPATTYVAGNMTTVQCGPPHRRPPSPEANISAGEETPWAFLDLTVLDPNRARLVSSGPIGGRYSTVAELRVHRLGLASSADGAPHARCISISMTCLWCLWLFGRLFPDSPYAAGHNIAYPFCCGRRLLLRIGHCPEPIE